MQTLIVDGYNLIYAIPELEDLLDESLESARIGAIRLFSDFINSRKDIDHVYIVFDGQAEFGDEEVPADSGITAVYTTGKKTADEKILEIIKESKRPDQITVISNDNFLYNNVRIHGGRVKTVNEFLKMVR